MSDRLDTGVAQEGMGLTFSQASLKQQRGATEQLARTWQTTATSLFSTMLQTRPNVGTYVAMDKREREREREREKREERERESVRFAFPRKWPNPTRPTLVWGRHHSCETEKQHATQERKATSHGSNSKTGHKPSDLVICTLRQTQCRSCPRS